MKSSPEKVNNDKKTNPTELPNKGLDSIHEDQSYLYRTYNSGTRSSSPNAMAVYNDGTIYRYSDQKMEFKDGEMLTTTVPLEWREEVKITQKSIQSIKDLLDEFDTSEDSAHDSSSGVEVSFLLDEEAVVFILQGDDSPRNYMIFTKISNAISTGVVPKK